MTENYIKHKQRILDAGCGTKKVPGALGIDIAPLQGVDIVHDLNDIPYPFKSESFDEIYMLDVLEHLNDPIAVIGECFRLLVSGGKLHIRVVYWNHRYSYSDPQHKHAFTEVYFEFFIGKRRPYYLQYCFSDLNIEYIFDVKAKKKFGTNQKKLLEKAYHMCNIIQGMNILLLK